MATPVPVVSSRYRLVSLPPKVVIAVRPAETPASSKPNGTGVSAATVATANTAATSTSRLLGMIGSRRQQPPCFIKGQLGLPGVARLLQRAAELILGLCVLRSEPHGFFELRHGPR